jgi:DNA-binding CsgD family transcriptional regulator
LEALAGGRSTPTVIWIPYIHMYVDDYEWPIELMLRWIERARRSGSAILASLANGILAEAQWRAGALRDAHASAHAAWRLAEELGPGFPGWAIALGALAQSLLAIGETAQAFELLSSQGWLEGAPSEAMLMPLPRAVRAETLIAAGELDRGAAELAATTSWLQEQGESSPGAWRYPAAHVDALLVLGRREEAADKARGWLRRTRRFGTRSTLGMAERAVGLSSGSERQLEWLRRAEKTLAASPARVEHARALVELGAAMRRAGQAKEARDPLRKALDQASRCGASALVDRARVELAAAGGRRRRDALRGADSLTPSERRVAQLAARLTNREIANSLFISPKTVERHLGNTYLKLGANDRRELAVELE